MSQYYTVSQKNVTPLACYNFDAHEWIFIFFGRNVTDEVDNQKTSYYTTSNNYAPFLGPVWCTQSIVLTLKGDSALTR